MMHPRSVQLACCLLLSILTFQVATAAENWTQRLELTNRHALASLACNWSTSGSKLQLAADNHATIELRLLPGRLPDVELTPERLFPDDFADRFQLHPVPSLATNIVTLLLRRESHDWTLFLENQPVARFPEPWAGALTIRQPVNALPPADSQVAPAQSTPLSHLTDPKPGAWECISGTWQLPDMHRDGNHAPNHAPLINLTPDCDLFQGSGPHSVLLAGRPSDHHYRFHAAVHHNSGTNGLLFLVSETGACHGFTVCTDPESGHLIFALWQGSIDEHAPRHILSSVATELTPSQWLRMEVLILDDRVICRANNLEILEQRLSLPPGGRFGLLAQTGQATHFADISTTSHAEYRFDSLPDLQFHMLQQNGKLHPIEPQSMTPAEGEPDSATLDAPGSRTPRAWIFGAADDTPHQLEICLQPRSQEDFAASLIAGWQGPDHPFYRFTCRQLGTLRTAALEQVSANEIIQLVTVELKNSTGPLRLTLDALHPGELRGLVNGRQMVVAHPDMPVSGAGGLQLEGRGHILLSLPRYTSTSPIFSQPLPHAQTWRENALDAFTNADLCNWKCNGGAWSAAHGCLSGGSTNSFAALWSGFDLEGDFCLDARVRSPPDSINLTLLSQTRATSDGYSLTTSVRASQPSQLDTRLFRNGRQVAATLTRITPHDTEWHNLRVCRTGNQLLYQLDQEPLFSWRDPSPLTAGGVGIWLDRNQTQIRNVRLSAASFRPHPFRFWKMDRTPATDSPAAMAASGIRIHNRPVNLLTPAIWQAADPVSTPFMHFNLNTNRQVEMRVTSINGAGTFLVAPHLPPLPARRLLGWHFEIARHPQTCINFEFSAGQPDAANPDTLNTTSAYSFILCGSTQPSCGRAIAGALPNPPPASPPDADSSAYIWTPVDVWLPAEIVHRSLCVRLDGFGNLLPGDVQQGLTGNPPGAWYAIRNLHEIYSDVPAFDAPPAARTDLDAITAKARLLPSEQRHAMRLPAGLDASEPTIEWVLPVGTTCTPDIHPDATTPEALRIGWGFPWPNPLLPVRAVFLDQQPAQGWQENNDYVVLLPRTPTAQPDATTVQLHFAEGRSVTQRVTLATAFTSQPPVLLSCEMPANSIQTFEARTEDLAPYRSQAEASLDFSDSSQGTCLRIQNHAASNTRLSTRLLSDYDPVETPLLQFRYKTAPGTHVLLTYGTNLITVSEKTNGRSTTDNSWHTWLGTALQSFGTHSLKDGLAPRPATVQIESDGHTDPPANTLELDDIARGPAFGPCHPLNFTPCFSDRHGVKQILYTCAAGSTPWSERSDVERAALAWSVATNNQSSTPDLSLLPEGMHHLLTKACNSYGIWSAVYDVPFLIDRTPPLVTCAVQPTPDRYNGTCLNIHIVSHAAPPRLKQMTLSYEGKPLDLTTDNGRITYTATTADLEIDWPWLLRKQIRNSKDGDTLVLTLSGIADAAGNEAPPQQIPIRLNLADDKQPPSVLPLALTTNLLAYAPQFRSMQNFFTGSQQVTAQPAQQEAGCLFVPVQHQGGDNASLTRQFMDQPWDPEAFPWLAISIRLDSTLAPGTTPFDLRLQPAGTPPDATGQTKPRGDYLWSLPIIDNQPFAVGHVDWKPGQWIDLLVNVRDLMRALTRQPRACPLREIALVLRPKAKFILHIRGMAILAPWSPDDVLKFRAYDLNDIAGLVWQNGGKSGYTGIRPACLTLPPDDAQWLKLRVADQPGNFSPVFMIPMPPNVTPPPENLPPTQPVEDF